MSWLVQLLAAAHAADFDVYADPLLVAEVGTYTENGVSAPAVVYDPATSQYVMLFESRVPDALLDETFDACPWVVALGRATSSDALSWTADEAPVLMPVAETPWSCGAAKPDLIDDDGTLRLWFAASDDAGPTGVAYASSTDAGATWTIESDLIIERDDVAVTSTVHVDGTWSMLLEIPPSIYLATSTDPATGFTFYDEDGDGVADPVIEAAAAYWLSHGVYNPSLTCERDTTFGYTLALGGIDEKSERYWGKAVAEDLLAAFYVSADSPYTKWSAGAEWTHFSVDLIGDGGMAAFFSAEGSDGLRYIGLSANVVVPWDPADVQSNVCVNDVDTGGDSGDGDTGADSGDDTAEPDDDGDSGEDEGGGGGEDEGSACGCDAAPTSAVLPGVLVLALIGLRRSRHAAPRGLTKS